MQWKNVQRSDDVLKDTQLVSGRACMQIGSKSEPKAFNCLILGVSCSVKLVLRSSRCLISHQVSPAMRNYQQWLSGGLCLSTLLCCPQLEADICFPDHLATLINPVPSIVPTFMFFPPRAQMARFRVSCLGESGVTTLVKEPEAELIIVIKASYLHNTSQAEGTQSSFSRAMQKKLSSSHTAMLLLPGRPGAETWK